MTHSAPLRSTADHLVWETDWQPGHCRLGPLENVEKAGEIAYSRSRLEGFPAEARFVMNPNFPNDTLLTDRMVNHSGLLVVSERIVEILRRQPTGPIEFLPVTIIDHRNRAVEPRWFIANPLVPVACLDVDACGPQWNKILPGKIRSVKTLALDPERIDRNRVLFSCDQYHLPKIVHRSLAELLLSAGCTGSRFLALRDYRA